MVMRCYVENKDSDKGKIMTISKKWLVTALVLPLAFGATNVMAKGGEKGNKGGHGCDVEMSKQAFKKLDLTDAQKAELKTIRQDEKASKMNNGSQKREQMQAYRQKERDLVLAADFNEQQAQSLAQEMVAQRTERQVEKLRTQHRMMSVLTAEQKQKLTEMQDKRMQKCQQKMQKKMEKKQANNG